MSQQKGGPFKEGWGVRGCAEKHSCHCGGFLREKNYNGKMGGFNQNTNQPNWMENKNERFKKSRASA